MRRTAAGTSKGGRGIEASEKLRHAMKAHAEVYQERMESKILRALDEAEMTPNIPLLYARSCPPARVCSSAPFVLENKPKQARLHVLRVMAAIGQFLIDESWVVALRVTGMEEPLWGWWAPQNVGALRRQCAYSRLNELKEEEWLSKKLPNPKAKAKGESKDNKDASG